MNLVFECSANKEALLSIHCIADDWLLKHIDQDENDDAIGHTESTMNVQQPTKNDQPTTTTKMTIRATNADDQNDDDDGHDQDYETKDTTACDDSSAFISQF